MELFKWELKKIWSPGVLAALILLGAAYYWIRPGFYIEYFCSGPSAQAEFELPLDWVRRYGPTVEPSERAEIDAQLEEQERLFSEALRAIPEAAELGVSDYDSFEDFKNRFYHENEDMDDSEKERINAFITQVFFSSDTNYETVRALRIFLEAYDQEPETARRYGAFGASQRLDTLCWERVQALQAGALRGVIPFQVHFSTMSYFEYLALWCMLSVIVLLSPALVRDRMHRIRSAQWTSRWGRRILNAQLTAGLFSGLLLTVLNMGIYAVPFLTRRVLPLLDVPLYSIWPGSGYPWFDWTYGQYLLALLGLTAGLALTASGLTLVLSQYSGNYVSMLLKALPLCVALCLLGALIMYDPFFFSNYLTRFLTLPGGEIICTALLLGLSLGLCAAACARQRRREML